MNKVFKRVDWHRRGQALLSAHINVEKLPSGEYKASTPEKSATAGDYQSAVQSLRDQLKTSIAPEGQQTFGMVGKK